MEEITPTELTDLIHSIFCFKEHPKNCKFEVESQRADSETLPEHIYWNEFTTNLKKLCEVDTCAELLDRLTEATEVISTLTSRTAPVILLYIQKAMDSNSKTAFKDQITTVSQNSQPLDESFLDKF
jgi:hypothetical protein